MVQCNAHFMSSEVRTLLLECLVLCHLDQGFLTCLTLKHNLLNRKWHEAHLDVNNQNDF